MGYQVSLNYVSFKVWLIHIDALLSISYSVLKNTECLFVLIRSELLKNQCRNVKTTFLLQFNHIWMFNITRLQMTEKEKQKNFLFGRQIRCYWKVGQTWIWSGGHLTQIHSLDWQVGREQGLHEEAWQQWSTYPLGAASCSTWEE